ncbi:MAG: hypothetical protein M3O73_04220 [Actinomycetota bacterium]|nr:hypothetical protein [Actinomycetota bacterium]
MFDPPTVLPLGSPGSPGTMRVSFKQERLPPIVFPFSSSALALRETDPPTVLPSSSRNEELLIESDPVIVLPVQSKNSSMRFRQTLLVLGEWVYVAAGVIVIGSLPVLGLNIARVARREWKRHRQPT